MRKKLHPIVVALRTIREKQNISQQALALMSGWQQNQMSTYEVGKHIPTLTTLSIWANALGYEIVLRRKEEPNAVHDAHSTGVGLSEARR